MTDPLGLYRLDGKVAVVTGGSRGLGREMVLAFAQVGAAVVIASRKMAACEALAEEVRATTGRRALPVACNVSRWDDCHALYEKVYSEFEKVDILVNNAGGSPLYGNDPRNVTEELWHKTLNLNLTGPFRLSALFGGRMHDEGGGVILNVSSVAGIRPGVGSLPYGAAKAGLQNMTVGYAHAYGPSVRVNAVIAGSFMTDIAQAWDLPAVQAAARQRDALGRLGEPEEIVGTALYLVSDASSFTTGAVVRADGGHAA